MDLIKVVEDAFGGELQHPHFRSGDTIGVHYKIKEGNKERIQVFKGVIIQISGEGDNKRFTIRKMSGNIGVERIIPINSPAIEKIEIYKHGRVRRSRLFYLRERRGKKARIKERRKL